MNILAPFQKEKLSFPLSVSAHVHLQSALFLFAVFAGRENV